MASHVFRFERFAVHQDRCAMKVGTDSVVFGAWVGVSGYHRILDIGTGTGVLALIAAQRNAEAWVHAVEIDTDAAAQAAENAQASPWADRIRVHHMDVRRMRSDTPFDLVLSNPPYYPGRYVSSDARERVAKHGVELGFPELLTAVSRVLAPHGTFAVIVPADREHEFRALALEHGLHPARRCAVRYVAHRPPKRVMLELRFSAQPVVEEELVVEGEGAKAYSPAARALVAGLLDR
jgi:tRNA1Val (adenine37-N6)-methyltransferase